jgi:hypothetical protein
MPAAVPDRAPRDVTALLRLAAKLVGLAREQSDALTRGSTGQFDWLVLRRDEVTAQLQQLSASAPPLDEVAIRRLQRLQQELRQVDAETQAFLQGRLAQVKTARNAVRRFHRAVSPYVTAGTRVPSFVDRTR